MEDQELRAADQLINSLVEVWVMGDFKRPLNGANSYKELIEIDCDGSRSHSTYMVFYSGRKGAGESLGSNPLDDAFEPWIPESHNEVIGKVACGVIERPSRTE